MTPQEYAKVKDAFAELLQEPDGQRVAFAKQHWGEDDEVLRELLSLLTYHRDDTVLESIPDVTATDVIAVKAPRRRACDAIQSM